MKQPALLLLLLLLVFTVMVAGQTMDAPIFPLDYCGNRTACYNITFMEKSHELCKEYAGKVAIPSKLCVNGMILCDGHKYSAGCLFSAASLRYNCDYAKENCFAYLKEGATDPDPDNPIFPVAACGNRTACSHIKHVERTDDFCKDYAGSVVVPSKLCINAMIWCEYRRLRGSCFKSPNRLSSNCDYAKDTCYKDLQLSETTTTGYTRAPTESSTADATTVEYDTTIGGWYTTTTSKSSASDRTTDGWYTTTSSYSEEVATTSEWWDRTTSDSEEADRTTDGWYTTTSSDSEEVATTSEWWDRTTSDSEGTEESTVENDTTDGEYTDTTITEVTTTEQATSAGPRAGDPCTTAGKRAGNADSCLSFLECSGEIYKESACRLGYIYYEAFGFCLPGNGKACQLYR